MKHIAILLISVGILAACTSPDKNIQDTKTPLNIDNSSQATDSTGEKNDVSTKPESLDDKKDSSDILDPTSVKDNTTKEDDNSSDAGRVMGPVMGDQEYLYVKEIGFDLLVYYNSEKKIYRYTGSIEAPSPCYQIKESQRMTKSFPGTLTLDFVLDPLQTFAACAQVMTPMDIQGEVAGAQGMGISVLFNGKEIGKKLEQR